MDAIATILPTFLAAEPAGAHAPGAQVGSGPPWAILIPLLPLLASALCGVCAMLRVKSKAPAFIVVAMLGASFLATAAVWLQGGGPGPMAGASVAHGWDWIQFAWGDGPGQALIANFSLYLDSLTLLWMLFVTGLATLIALYASEYMSHDVGQGYNRFFAYFALFVFAMSCLVMGDNLLMLFLGWEGVGLCSYLLIGYFYKKPSAVAAAKKAFIVNRIGDLGLVLGVFTTFVTFGTIEYAPLFEMVGAGVDGSGHALHGSWQATWIPIFFMIGAFGKSAQLPLYVWLPDAMEGPTPVSALIHAATMVTAGVYLIARMYPIFLLDDAHTALTIVAWTGALTALLAATIGMAQFDIKRIMAYSTVSQLGYMFAGLGVLTTTGAAFHVFTHAFFKATLFLCCGAVMHGFAGQLDLRKLSGVAFMKGWGVVGVAMLVGCLNLAGFPFTAGYFSKDMILAETFVTPGSVIGGASMVGWILLLTAGLTAYYTFRVFFRVFVGPQMYEPGEEHGHAPHRHDHGPGHPPGHGEHDLADARDQAQKDEPGGAHPHGHDFHPHAPGLAINAVLAILAVASVLAALTYFIHKPDHGWVGAMVHHSTAHFGGLDAHHGDEAAHASHGSFLGLDPHKAMYYVSAVIGMVGIFVAWLLHYRGRTGAAVAPADRLLGALGPIPRWAQQKWFVDELYDFVIVKPLWALSNVFHVIDKLIVDGLVNLAGLTPRGLGAGLRPSQNGLLHSYAAGMAGGIVFILLVVWAVS
ncbi:MAG: NADH-quinone oxidoreductase subunit L [Phycisphaerales bacterium]|nr:NADH-quinone oxidoreductase subunit L [Phycisphaerales bacterium]